MGFAEPALDFTAEPAQVAVKTGGDLRETDRNISPSKSDFADADQLLATVEQLGRYGLRSAYLTGGKPSVH